MKNGSVLSGLESKYGNQMVAEELLHTLLELRKSGELTDEELKVLLEQYNLISRLGGKKSSENQWRQWLKDNPEEAEASLGGEEEGGEEKGRSFPTKLVKVLNAPDPIDADKDKVPPPVPGAPEGEEPPPVPGADKGGEIRTTSREKERPKG